MTVESVLSEIDQINADCEKAKSEILELAQHLVLFPHMTEATKEHRLVVDRIRQRLAVLAVNAGVVEEAREGSVALNPEAICSCPECTP